MAGEIEIAGEVLTVCPIALGAQTDGAAYLAALVSPVSTCGMLGEHRASDLPPRYRALLRHARVWASLIQPAQPTEV